MFLSDPFPRCPILNDSLPITLAYLFYYWALINVKTQHNTFLKDILLFPNYSQLKIVTCHGHLPSTSVRIKSWAAAAAGLQQPLKRVQDGD